MLKKNQILSLRIESVTNEGQGVGHTEDGMTVFVPQTAPGDTISCRIVKVLSHYSYGIIEKLLSPAACRIQPDCPSFKRCGGCSLRHLTYEEELNLKTEWVRSAVERIGKLSVPVGNCLASPKERGYRNKAQYPIGIDENGHAFCGFYANRTHTIIPAEGCALQPENFEAVCRAVCDFIDRYHISVYNELTGQGLCRHLYLRQAEKTGELMVCLVINGQALPHAPEFVETVEKAAPNAASVLLNLNRKSTNVILGPQNIVLKGKDSITDILCGVKIRISPLSFYQVNHDGAEQLYAAARKMAELKPGDRLLDLYCGAGTIGLSMADGVQELIGVEIVESAVEDARRNAEENGVRNSRFLCADAGTAAQKLADEGLTPSVVVVDPPRKGCDEATVSAIVRMSPERVVMVSCNPATMARDAARFEELGYRAAFVQPVDMFPRTNHVETVVLMSRVSK